MKRNADGLIIEATAEELLASLTDFHAILRTVAIFVRSQNLQNSDDDGMLCGLGILLDQLAEQAGDHATMHDVIVMAADRRRLRRRQPQSDTTD